MAYEIDREKTNEPSLAKMTQKAIEILGHGDQGFFLMIEGGKIDKACHNNDAATAIREVLMFDEAVGIGLDYARSHKNTLVIWTADHETGGMFIGYYEDIDKTGHNVTRGTLEKLQAVDSSFDVIAKEFGESKSIVQVQNVVKHHYGITVTDKEAWNILQKQCYDVFHDQPTNIIGQVISPHLGIAFGTGQHTATPVMIGATGPYSQLLRGYHDNTYIAEVIIRALKGEI
jgi:alkaline phosphatase